MTPYYFTQAAVGGDLEYAQKHGLFDNPNYFAQEKLDGARYLLHKDMDGNVRIYSRQISRITGQPVDKTRQLTHLARAFMAGAPAGTVLDGEVCAPGKRSSSNLVTRVTGSKPERAFDIQRDSGFLVYKAFDLLVYDGKSMLDKPLKERLDRMYGSFIEDDHYISILPPVYGVHRKHELYESVLRGGGEGIILKDQNAPYYEGERHKSWVKVKRQKTYDVVFMGIDLANEMTVKKGEDEATRSRIAGKAGAIRYGQYVVKKRHSAASDSELKLVLQVPESRDLLLLGTVSGFDDGVRDDITENHERYAKEQRVFEVTAQEQFNSGALRHPRFVQWRDDKRASSCVFRADEG